jgi:cytochrome d ubiquinol oxidase subunit I
MFFGWNKVSKKFHLASTWLVAFGANLSALWILVANAWMQLPVGMQFNPDNARNEMMNFWQVFLSPVAVVKFIHTINSGFVLASVFVIGVSAWFILKKRELILARRSILIAAIFGLLSSLVLIFTGDSSARQVARIQPMKFAAIEGMYRGQEQAGLVVIGVLSPQRGDTAGMKSKDFIFRIEIPKILSYMASGSFDGFVPGINDQLYGNPEENIISAQEKIDRGRVARQILADFKKAKDEGSTEEYEALKAKFFDPEFKEEYFRYFGYGFLNDTGSLVPNVPLTFYSFHVMVGLGFYFVLFFILFLLSAYRNKLGNKRILLRLAVITIPLAYIATMTGWVVAEVGRQPWAIQDLLPVMAATSHIDAASVQITFWLFAVLFTALLIAEIQIMFKQIRLGPKEGGK